MTKIQQLATEYAKLVNQENKIKVVKKELGLKVKEEMEKMGAKSFGIDKGMFSIHSVPSWTYSKKFKAKLEELEILKELEIKKGIAKATYSEYIWFKTKK